MIPRLKAGIFVRAIIRRAEVAGAAAFVVRKGSEEAGAIFLKIARLDGTSLVLSQARRGRWWTSSQCKRAVRESLNPSSAAVKSNSWWTSAICHDEQATGVAVSIVFGVS